MPVAQASQRLSLPAFQTFPFSFGESNGAMRRSVMYMIHRSCQSACQGKEFYASRAGLQTESPLSGLRVQCLHLRCASFILVRYSITETDRKLDKLVKEGLGDIFRFFWLSFLIFIRMPKPASFFLLFWARGPKNLPAGGQGRNTNPKIRDLSLSVKGVG